MPRCGMGAMRDQYVASLPPAGSELESTKGAMPLWSASHLRLAELFLYSSSTLCLPHTCQPFASSAIARSPVNTTPPSLRIRGCLCRLRQHLEHGLGAPIASTFSHPRLACTPRCLCRSATTYCNNVHCASPTASISPKTLTTEVVPLAGFHQQRDV